MCLGLALGLGLASHQSVYVFTLVFLIVWLGALIVTANSRLLGYRLYAHSPMLHACRSVMQNVCLLGYGLFPLTVSALIHAAIPLFWILRLMLVACALVWSTLGKQTQHSQYFSNGEDTKGHGAGGPSRARRLSHLFILLYNRLADPHCLIR